MKTVLATAVLAAAICLPVLAHAETGCDKKMAGSTSYGDKSAQTGKNQQGANTPATGEQKVAGATSYGDDKAKSAKMDQGTGAQDCSTNQ